MWDLLDEVRREQAAFRMGHADWPDFYDEDTGIEKPTRTQEIKNQLQDTLKQIRFLEQHNCAWTEDLRCIHCGADGRA